MKYKNSKLFKSKIFFALLFAVLIFIFSFLIFGRRGEKINGALDFFARCLAEKNIVMYGANWCPHCQNEKKAFGDSFRFINYVECPANPQKCLAAGIRGYPTWIFPDGQRLEGEQGIQKLSNASGCPLSEPPQVK